ncbi:hypothetical protein AG0111_0g167 [Alternaria gaisen]|uniref:Uncharacterized protein n=1 Tax=Alternaria gaisen TaxID=167740 RepID=A0ACB6G184_9PLEO|nr:hypothetical protein AG0111_0g167 [Alternaria gaisen]
MASKKPHAFNPPSVPEPAPTYNQVCITPVVSSSKLITLAGQTGMRKDGPISSDLKEQAKGAYDSIHKCLAAAGATPRDIVMVRHYIVKETGNPELDEKDVVDRGWGELWMEYMDKEAEGHRPPDTVVGVASLATKELFSVFLREPGASEIWLLADSVYCWMRQRSAESFALTSKLSFVHYYQGNRYVHGTTQDRDPKEESASCP